MHDPTEKHRRAMVEELNSSVQSLDPEVERKSLEEVYGQVWDTDQVRAEFEVISFLAPYVEVKRKSDGAHGTLMFQHHPRFYFNFIERP